MIFKTFEMIERLIIDSEKINNDKKVDGNFTFFIKKEKIGKCLKTYN